jgi:hypothetical protein
MGKYLGIGKMENDEKWMICETQKKKFDGWVSA